MIHLGIIPDGNRRYIKKHPEKNLVNLWDELFNNKWIYNNDVSNNDYSNLNNTLYVFLYRFY